MEKFGFFFNAIASHLDPIKVQIAFPCSGLGEGCMVRDEKEQNKMPGSRNIGVCIRHYRWITETEPGKKAWEGFVPRSWTCDEAFETLEEFKQNYMKRFELEDN